ncbi:hypothetical protein AK812_SmicGene25199 [Symbiodinium microadriaticum]|uniref:Reverse transcriptase domain-containing protein n=1 Tax=Symbiodinium microadriaticum TaxID=2951 RepID=A0A1Q9DCR0_SYMMI|nr:hypothetical protein AK812_SmicGene25199 [Symbiodinium microadriaticum]
MKGCSILTELESNREWASALSAQCTWEAPYDTDFHAATLTRFSQVCSAAGNTLPQDRMDYAVTEREVVDVKNSWSSSKGMPPDLLPRAIFQANSPGWNLTVWSLQRWAGPGGAAHRPSLWRKAALCPVHKSGPANLAASFRLIFVKVQMGLLQEALLTQRWLTRTRAHIQPCQSGYVRGVEDAHLLLHEVSAEAIYQQRALWTVMGDFRKAFPSVCREDLVCTLADGPHVNGQCLKLLADILRHDTVVIWHSGYSEATVSQGIPEGGTLGPFGYPVLLDTLVRELLAHNCGLGVGWVIPDVWKGRLWSGLGQPDPALVALLMSALRSASPNALLPSAKLLDENPNLEASALQALNDVAPLRIAAILHADDPVLLGCCRWSLQKSLDILANWAFKHKASFHVTEKKTVAMVTPSPAGSSSCSLPPAPILKGIAGQEDRALVFKTGHKWLGLYWSASLDLSVALRTRLAIAQKAFALLAGLAQRDALPLHLVSSIFWSKVFPSLCVGSWLLGIAPDAQNILDSTLKSWAKQLLGASEWQNAATALSELGWALLKAYDILDFPSWMSHEKTLDRLVNPPRCPRQDAVWLGEPALESRIAEGGAEKRIRKHEQRVQGASSIQQQITFDGRAESWG